MNMFFSTRLIKNQVQNKDVTYPERISENRERYPFHTLHHFARQLNYTSITVTKFDEWA